MTDTFDAIVIGAGAAGLLCAIEAGKRGRRVAVIEHADRAGKKILISGGGRCNFTNLHTRPENFVSANPHFAKSALARYTPRDFIGMVVTLQNIWRRILHAIWRILREWTNWRSLRERPESSRLIGSACFNLTLNRTIHCRPWRRAAGIPG